MKLGIVVIGYNRTDSMARLLTRLNKCHYEDQVQLIVSIDYGGNNEVRNVAEEFVWQYGKKIIKTFSERQGLRKHVLHCGTYMDEFDLDAVAVFEDDVFPAKDFYNFMKQSVGYYGNDNRIAGISLYTHLWNVHAGLPFQPRYSGFDVFFMQFPQSWGQVWMRKQWDDFYKWYQKNSEEFCEIPYMPENVCNWGNNSWLKYHVRYCIDNNKYFVYPYMSLSTCLSEVGEHASVKTNIFQVPLSEAFMKTYDFIPLSNRSLRYDAFFESENIKELFSSDEVCIDLYGKKKNFSRKRYWLTVKECNYSVVRSFALSLKPHELNVIEEVNGNSLFLYDTTKPVEHMKRQSNWLFNFQYYCRMDLPVKTAFKLLLLKIIRKCWDKIFFKRNY